VSEKRKEAESYSDRYVSCIDELRISGEGS